MGVFSLIVIGILFGIPLFLLGTYSVLGRPTRIRQFTALRVSSRSANSFLGIDDSSTKDMTVGGYLLKEYSKCLGWHKYILPMIAFYTVYTIGLHFSIKHIEQIIDSQILANEIRAIFTLGALGFLGGVLFVLYRLVQLTINADLRPKAFVHLTIRLVLAPVLAIMIVKGTHLSQLDTNVALVFAVGIGMFPLDSFRFFRHWVRRRISSPPAHTLPLRNIQGIGLDVELRFFEEGITDAQHLAYEDLLHLLINTNFSIQCLIDWIDQALLYTYVCEDFRIWQEKIYCRGVLDVLGKAPAYYAHSDNIYHAIAKQTNQDIEIVRRFVDDVFQDPKVHQLWNYYKDTIPDRDLAEGLHSPGQGGPLTSEKSASVESDSSEPKSEARESPSTTENTSNDEGSTASEE
jgi:hypothetical protein